MNWDAIGAVGEIAGALAVVVSLIYLALQIRVSNRESIQSANREMIAESSKFYGELGTDEKTAELWFRGSNDDPSLSKTELAQYRSLMMQVILLWVRTHYLEQEQAVDDWFVKIYRTSRKRVVSSPGFSSWYKDNSDLLSDEFKSIIEDEMKTVSSYTMFGMDLDSED